MTVDFSKIDFSTPEGIAAAQAVIAQRPVPVTAASEPRQSAFETRALPLIALGVPVIPLTPRTKTAFLQNWQQLASTDPAQIAQWGQDYPDANAACVARAEPGGVWFFDVDRPGLRELIESQTGEKFPNTFMVRSQKEKGHFYFRQSAASIAMGNRKSSDEHGELYSARVSNAYVVSPLSLHPDTGKPYEVINDAPIVEAPQWLIDYLQGTKPKKTGDKELDDESLVHEGGRNTMLTSVLGRARQILKMDREQLLSFGLSINAKRCRPLLSDAEVKTIATSISKYEVKPVGKFEFSTSTPSPAEVREFETEPVNRTEIATEGLDFLPVKVLASTRLQDIYAADFEDYGWPLTLALPALVTAASVVVPPTPRSENLMFGEDPMTNLYTALIADVGAGKSQVIEWGARAIGVYEEQSIGQCYFSGKWGSAEQMLKSLHKKQESFINKSVLINPDEWSHLFAKARIPDASFPSVMTTSFYKQNQVFTLGGTGGGREYQLNLRMSFIGGIVEDEFDTVFGAGSLGGLYDRFLFGRAPDGFKWNYQQCPIESKQHWREWDLKPVRIDPSVYEAVKGWNKDNQGLGRVSEICVRIATIYASLDGRPEITGKDIEPLKPLALYQIGLRQVFRPNPGKNPDAVFANTALAWIQKHAEGWTSISRLKQRTWRIEQDLGPQVAVRSLLGLARSGRIELWLTDSGRELPSDYTGPIPRIGLVRRVK